MRMLLIGSSDAGSWYIRELSLEHRHLLARHLDMRGLYQALQSYLVHGALVEQELFGHMEKIQASYIKFQGELEDRLANMGGDLGEALKELSTKEDEFGN
ncbi:uncharacterized protein A4U43_C03F22030 [Asparagus officinalis]|uniref:Uncharacterized protein n=1 Tax=Asparagus officinalis TaxID=4686 RepID=A0A5P1FC06_ASPOF|nr:uncharacterized protein A4U43_C03F22030 [Asparagus officinalis]